MAKLKNSIFSLKEIFTDLLEDAEKDCFFIPAYQRGYKWASSGGNSQVEVLMKDLNSAFERNANRYYLQFITLKENDNLFEVIDGQQRLTTLTILFSLLNHYNESDNFTVNKFNYEVRENFINTFIYKDISLILKSSNWDSFLSTHQTTELDINNQDVYFIYHATKAIHEFIDHKLNGNRQNFYSYLCEQVYLIVNVLGNEMKSEKIFINVNKGVKLQDEDLVKGLLITKIPIDNQTSQYRMSEFEINESRVNLGRQWDDLVLWASRKDIKDFFKIEHQSTIGLKWLINLAYPDVQSYGNSNPLFTYLDDLYKTKKETATGIFTKIRKTMLLLNDWFAEPELHNLLGFILHMKKPLPLRMLWINLISANTTKSEILQKLKKLCLQHIPIDDTTGELKELNYTDHKAELFNLFLILELAKFLPIQNRKAVPYNFSNIASESWSIEHIFPQNAKDFKNINSLSGTDLDIIKELLPDTLNQANTEQEKEFRILCLFNKIKGASDKCSISKEELEDLGFLLEKGANDLHKLGNLALLQQGMNSRLSNHFFDGKRKIIVKKVSEGSFVPYHTYDVFSKLIIESEAKLQTWSKTDIGKHEAYIKFQIKNILNYLK